VRLLAEAIEDAPAQSVQLFSGFRGTGKSTQLRRLRKRLVRGGYAVLLIDIEDYLNTQVPVDIADFTTSTRRCRSTSPTSSSPSRAPLVRLSRGVERTRHTLDQSPAGAPARARTALRQHLALLLMELSRTEQIAGYTSAAEHRQESLAIIKSLLPDLAPHERPRWRASILTSDRRHRRPPAADS
jgi:hypothetical protein